MQEVERRIFLTIFLLLAGAAALFGLNRQAQSQVAPGEHVFVTDIDNWRQTKRQRQVITPYDFTGGNTLYQLPLQVGDWCGVALPETNEEVMIILQPEQYLRRRYQLPNDRYLWLTIIGSHKSKSFHPSEICYSSAGWQTDVNLHTVKLPGGNLYALQVIAKKGAQEHVVLYFYLWPAGGRNPTASTVLFKLTAPIMPDVKHTLALEDGFIRLFFSRVEK